MRKFLVALIGVALWCVPASAKDTLVFITYSGTISSGDDATNGWGGGNLAGDTFSLVYTFDLSQGSGTRTHTHYCYQAGDCDDYYTLGHTGPASAKLTIGSVSQTFDGSGSIDAHGDDTYFPSTENVTFASTGATFTATSSVFDFWVINLAQGQLYDTYDVDTLGEYGSDPVLKLAGSFTSGGTNGVFDVDHIFAVADLPEPGTWLLLLLGFFTVGIATRLNYARRLSLSN